MIHQVCFGYESATTLIGGGVQQLRAIVCLIPSDSIHSGRQRETQF